MNSQKIKTQTLFDNLKTQIISNILPENSKLPSEAELIEQYGISRYGARKVIDMLVDENLVRKHQGKGCFVRSLSETNTRPADNSNQILLIASRAEHFYFLKSITGIESALRDSGYTLTIKLSNYNSRIEANLLKEAFCDHYAGFLIFPSESAYLYTNLHLYRYIENHNIPCIVLGNRLPCTTLPSVVSDDYIGGHIAADFFLQKGHSTFACLMNQEEYSGCMRYAGFTERLALARVPVSDSHIFWFCHEEKDSAFSSRAGEILELAKKTTAFFCFNDAAAVNLYRLLTEHGFRVPEDISIIGYDDSYLCEINPVPLTALHQDPETAGFAAAKNLLALIKDSSYDCNKVFLPYIVERDSVSDLTGHKNRMEVKQV